MRPFRFPHPPRGEAGLPTVARHKDDRMDEVDPNRLARSVADAMYAKDRAARAMGIEIVDVGEGFARARFIIREDMLNGHDIAHGGFIFALADTAFTYACNARNRVTIALGCTISFAAPGRLGARIDAVARERTAGGRTGVFDVDVVAEDETILALFRGTSYGVTGTVI